MATPTNETGAPPDEPIEPENAAMTDEQMRVAIAEALGATYSEDKFGNPTMLMEGMVVWLKQRGEKGFVVLNKLPDYPKDLNAINEAEKVLTREQQYSYAQALLSLPGIGYGGGEPIGFCWPVLHATARQRCEAFIATIGRTEAKP